MAVNKGVLKGVGQRPTPGVTFKGPVVFRSRDMNTGNTGIMASHGGQTSGGGTETDSTTVAIQGSRQSANGVLYDASLFQVLDYLGNVIFDVPLSGGAFVEGDHLFVTPSVFGSHTGFNGAISQPPLFFTTGGTPSVMNIYGGTGVPTTFLASVACNVGDYYFRQDGTTSTTHIYRCTTAGTPGTWTGFA